MSFFPSSSTTVTDEGDLVREPWVDDVSDRAPEQLPAQEEPVTKTRTNNGRQGLPKLGFPESVELEKTTKPLGPDASSSSRLRRLLFQGWELSAEDAQARVGGSSGLLGAATRLMEEWGFEFTRGTDDSGHKTLRLKNPDHVPTRHIKKASSGQRRGTSSTPKPATTASENRPGGRTDVHDRIAELLTSGEPVSLHETIAMGASDAFLRREVNRLESEGYKFDVEGHARYRTYRMVKAPKAKKNKAESASNSTRKTGTIARIPLANGKEQNATQGWPAAIDALFDDLMTPVPKLGGAVRIMGQLIDEKDDDAVVLVLKNGAGVWRARVEGFAEASTEAQADSD